MTVRTFGTMGTVVSLRFPGGSLTDDDVAEVERVFTSSDRTYSLWDDASPLSAVARGELRLTDTDPAVRDVYALALAWRRRTDGAFTPHRPDGVVDLSGVVKALAMRDAGAVLDRRADDWLLAGGGDVLARGVHEGSPWTVGVVDPDRRDALAACLPLGSPRRAVATSGVAERGEHIWTRGAVTFAQVTVAADDIVTADVLATAIMAGDHADLDRLADRFPVDVLAFGRDGSAVATPGARPWLRRVPCTPRSTFPQATPAV
ncbi:FAD:protein FMN transferase [Curtobacterium sp. RRHDQ10]|uniref:FAD:protein FMN transferase n=1 Tax=Curtobacterium phyllosphaerae TaxID=3413379 RepID=UPI003BF21317